MYQRSSSPSPSIAPSIASTLPVRPSADIDPLTPIPVNTPGKDGGQKKHTGKTATEDAGVGAGVGAGQGSLNPGWAWSSGWASNTEEGAANTTPTKGKKDKSKGVFARVFKGSESGPSSNTVAHPTSRNQSGDPAFYHTRSESTEVLQPSQMSARASFEALSTAIRPRTTSRSQTPPVAVTSSTKPSTASSPPSSFPKKVRKTRRPVSLNLPLEPPPTTNNLSPETRAELLRKNRKLQQVLGTEYTGSGSSTLDEAIIASATGSLPTWSPKPSTGSKLTKSLKNSTSQLRTSRSRSFSVNSPPSSATSFGDIMSDGMVASPRTGSLSATSPGGFGLTSPAFLKVMLTTPTPMSPAFSLATTEGGQSASTSQSKPNDTPSDPNASSALETTPPRKSTKSPSPPLSPDISISSDLSPDGKKRLSTSTEGPFSDRNAPKSPTAASVDTASQAETEDEGSNPRGRRVRDCQHTLIAAYRSTSTPPLTPLMSHNTSMHLLTGPEGAYRKGHGRSLSTSTTATGSTVAAGVTPESLLLSTEEAAALERKTRRDRLVKLHRFLGSHIPAELVLGSGYLDEGLPPVSAGKSGSVEDGSGSGTEEGHGGSLGTSGTWGKLKGKGKNKAKPGPSSSGGEVLETRKTGIAGPMTEHDRNLNVKRRVRLEKMFGEHPPQTLYLTQSSSSERAGQRASGTPASHYGEEDLDPVDDAEDDTVGELRSLEFLRHRHSLLSLSYLVEKEDRESLQELLTYVQGDDDDANSDDEDIVFAPPEDAETLESDDLSDLPPHPGSPKHRGKRLLDRHAVPLRVSSLPAGPRIRQLDPKSAKPPLRTSSLYAKNGPLAPGASVPEVTISPAAPPTRQRGSISSLASLDLPLEPVTADGFQQRRKRAAKLTKFFGTDYKNLFGEVLDSIENGVKDDQKKGSLSAEEVQDLLMKVRRLKVRHSQLMH